MASSHIRASVRMANTQLGASGSYNWPDERGGKTTFDSDDRRTEYSDCHRDRLWPYPNARAVADRGADWIRRGRALLLRCGSRLLIRLLQGRRDGGLCIHRGVLSGPPASTL